MKPWLGLFILLFIVPNNTSETRLQLDMQPWPLVQQCVDEPTTPPDDWTFTGTILLQGWAGLHTLRAEYSVPHIAHFIRWGDLAPGGTGILSPDNHWFAVVEGKAALTQTQAIVVYSTGNSEESYRLDWETILPPQDVPTLAWRDNEHLLYRSQESEAEFVLINPFTLEIENWTGIFPVDMGIDIFPAPNWTRAVMNVGGRVYYENDWRLLVAEPSELRLLEWVKAPIAWRPNSSHFAASFGEIWAYGGEDENLALFNRDGQREAIMFNLPEETFFGQNLKWSSDGQMLAFATSGGNLYIADLAAQQVTDTCHTAYGFAWSPDNRMIVSMPFTREQQPIQIFELETNVVFTHALHTGRVLGWRADTSEARR